MPYDEQLILNLFKARLNRLAADTSLDEYFTERIKAAKEELERNGIILVDDADDSMLLVDFAAWKYQNRDNNSGMPEWLRLARRERWLSGKGRRNNDTG